MSEIVILYDSRTGFTELMAKAVSEGVEGVKGISVELVKVGTPFRITKLAEVDAIIFGSPTIYASVTHEFKMVIEALKNLKDAVRLDLSGKIGGVFGSYGWDGGWVTDQLKKDLEELGMKIVAPTVSLVHDIYEPVRLTDKARDRCCELGRVIAEKVVGKN